MKLAQTECDPTCLRETQLQLTLTSIELLRERRDKTELQQQLHELRARLYETEFTAADAFHRQLALQRARDEAAAARAEARELRQNLEAARLYTVNFFALNSLKGLDSPDINVTGGECSIRCHHPVLVDLDAPVLPRRTVLCVS